MDDEAYRRWQRREWIDSAINAVWVWGLFLGLIASLSVLLWDSWWTVLKVGSGVLGVMFVWQFSQQG